jgi:hypothetical protein
VHTVLLSLCNIATTEVILYKGWSTRINFARDAYPLLDEVVSNELREVDISKKGGVEVL